MGADARPAILIVNDHPQTLMALEATVADAQLEILTAGSGEEALRVVLGHDVAAILMDVQMPGMSGFEAAERIRQRPRNAATPIIFVTAARPEEQDQFKGYELGAVDYLVAPVLPHVLRSKVAVFVELHRQRQVLEEQTRLLAESHRELQVQRLAELTRMNAELVRMNDELSAEVTERRHAEEALIQAQKMEAVGQLTGGVAHDFNNLLTIVSGSLQLLEERVKSDALSVKLVAAASGAAARGAELIRGLLAFSRKQVLQPHPVNLNRVVAGLLPVLERTLGENIELMMNRGKHLWEAMADPTQVETALLNLSVNARDAMMGGGKLTIETANVRLDEAYATGESDVSAGDYVMLAVSDSGTGMPQETIEHAFEPFFTTKPPGKGSGLGLSMVYGFVKQSGGHIEICSEVGHGTTVKLFLPRTGRVAKGKEHQNSELTHPQGGETVLVVEDETGVRELAVTFLSSLGYRVLQASDGYAALALIDQGHAVDLLCTDLILAGTLSGSDIAAEVKRHHPTIKVLYTSGYPRNASVHDGRFDIGAQLLAKPYTREDLALAVRRALDESSSN